MRRSHATTDHIHPPKDWLDEFAAEPTGPDPAGTSPEAAERKLLIVDMPPQEDWLAEFPDEGTEPSLLLESDDAPHMWPAAAVEPPLPPPIPVLRPPGVLDEFRELAEPALTRVRRIWPAMTALAAIGLVAGIVGLRAMGNRPENAEDIVGAPTGTPIAAAVGTGTAAASLPATPPKPTVTPTPAPKTVKPTPTPTPTRTPAPKPTPTPTPSRGARASAPPPLDTRPAVVVGPPALAPTPTPTSTPAATPTPTPTPSGSAKPSPPPPPAPDKLVTTASAATSPASPAGTAAASLGAPPPDPMVAAKAAIGSVLDRYRAAYQSLDATAVQAVWPAVNARALARAFEQIEAQRIDFTSCGYEVTGVLAQAFCVGEAQFIPKVGSRTPRVESRRWTFHLRRVKDAWLIDRIETR